MNPITKFKLFAAMGIVWCLSPFELHAQQNIQFQIGAPNASPLADSEEAMLRLIQLHIGEMEEVLALESSQTRKLKLAATTVTKKIFAEREKVLLPGPNGLPAGALPIAPVKPGVDSLSDEDAEKTQPEASKPGDGNVFFMPVEMDKVLKHELWLKTVDGVLTESQKKLREQKQKERESQIRQIAVQYRLMKLTEQLRLKPSQIEKMTEVIDKVEGDQLVDELIKGGGFPIGGEKKTIRSEDVASILTEGQLTQLFQDKPSNPFEQLLLGQMKSNKNATTFGVRLDENSNEPIVKEVVQDSAAMKYGLQSGDLIDSVNGKPIDTRLQCERALQEADVFHVSVLRDGKVIQLEKK